MQLNTYQHYPPIRIARVLTFWLKADKVPEVVVCALTLRHLIVRLGLDGVNDVREFNRVLDEEHRDIIADDVPIPLLGVELYRKATDVADGVLNASTMS